MSKIKLQKALDELAFTRRSRSEIQEKYNTLLTDYLDVVAQRNRLQDQRVTWAKCPQCGRIVAMKGIPCLVGICKCGYAILESEIIDVNIEEVLEEWYQRMRRVEVSA